MGDDMKNSEKVNAVEMQEVKATPQGKEAEDFVKKFEATKVTIGNYHDRGYWNTFYDQLKIMLNRNFTLQASLRFIY